MIYDLFSLELKNENGILLCHLILTFFLRSSVKAKGVGHGFDLCISTCIIAFAPSSPLLKKMEHTAIHLSFDWSVFRQNVDRSMSLIPFA